MRQRGLVRVSGVVAGCLVLGGVLPGSASAQVAPLPLVADVPLQPLAAQVRRLIEAGPMLGEPLLASVVEAIEAAIANGDDAAAVQRIQEALDPLCLIQINISAESRVKATRGPAKAELMQQGWRNFLIKVHNEAGITAKLRVSSPNAAPLYKRSTNNPEPKRTIPAGDVLNRFLDTAMYDRQPMNPTLSGLALEYRVMQLYCRDVGQREARLQFDAGQGTQDLGFRSEVNILFNAVPAVEVVLGVKDHDGSPVMGAFIIKDELGRIYPSPSRRLAPDFFFHPQVYRSDGESVMLPPGTYTVAYTRGPEYLRKQRRITVPSGVVSHREEFRLERWIEMAQMKWYSGDHHIHAAGCMHYEEPSEGVHPKDMMRHILGEDLGVGCVLSWGPCWYYQKQFFEGKVSALSTEKHLMRYDVEVSGFPSGHAGHLCLLRLSEDDYPGTTRIDEWPSWTLPILAWGKRQDAVVGFSHSGWGLKVDTDELPNYVMPPFDGIGANEYIVDVVHDVVDFISTVDTPYVWELNIWYHTLNCGFRCRISGETDFPCIYGEKVGLGRVYVKVDGALDYDKWVAGLKAGRAYVGDGLSHLVDFKVNDVAMGENGSELKLGSPSTVRVAARVAAYLEEEPDVSIQRRPYDQKPYWHIERSRIGASRKVPVEVIVNGYPVARKEIVADGTQQDLSFDVKIDRSSWVAMRILPSSHTNPVFVVVGGKPIRASRRSAQWCLDAVDQCWKQKSRAYRASEIDAARAAYDKARTVYRQRLAECEVD